MKRKPLVAGNWKLHNTVGEAVALARAVHDATASAPCDVVIAPVFTALAAVRDALSGSHVALAAQNVHSEERGAFTGEVSAPLLKDVGCSYVIVGHSERRQLFGETDNTVRHKVRALGRSGLKPIVCVGETLEQREQGATLGVVLGQVSASLAGVPDAEFSQLTLAYEPVWAIGTGKTATPEDAQVVHAAIRAQLERERGAKIAAATRILYGGSVKADNAESLFGQPDIDGGLVGGASLNAEQFVAIVAAAR
jgi:triosephosphate isomerase